MRSCSGPASPRQPTTSARRLLTELFKQLQSKSDGSHGGNCAILSADPDPIVQHLETIAQNTHRRVLFATITDQRNQRVARAILRSHDLSPDAPCTDATTIAELKRCGATLVVIKSAEVLWQCLRGKPLRIAQSELKYILNAANGAGIRFLFIGSADLWSGMASNEQLKWRITALQRPQIREAIKNIAELFWVVGRSIR